LLGGNLKVEDVERIFEMEASYAEDDWKDFAKEIRYPLPGEFYYLDEDPDTGLSSTAVSPTYQKSKEPAYRLQSVPSPSAAYR